MDTEKSFFEVDLSQVSKPKLKSDWQRSPKGYSREEIDNWIRQLGEVQRLSVERGYDYKDLQAMRASANPKLQKLGETHHKFYDHGTSGNNPDCLKLVWSGNKFEIENGHHRVHSAQLAGLRRMPAQVTAQTGQLAECRQHAFASNLLQQGDREDFTRRLNSPKHQSTGDAPDKTGSCLTRSNQQLPNRSHSERISR